MKKKNKMVNRILASILSIAMLLTMIPATAQEVEAAPESNYISMPITIRDYAADGMLFEFNQVGATGSATTGSTVYKQGDTAGFSMLATGAADYINNLPADESTTIAGTDLIQNGGWGIKTDPDPVTATLNSGAKQSVYGAWIRTDLVEPDLVNGEMVYTEAAVKYLATYMQQIMTVPETNEDGSYNTYFVKGHKLSELGEADLASKIRTQVTDGLGTYDNAKAKFESGNLKDYTQIQTYYDAAYFLLHNIFNDNTGYGMTVDAYNNLNLVQTTNDAGEICYVFNSGYDNTVYDYEKGDIYNSQTENITIAKTNSGKETYVRGNALPDARFDPLGKSGAGKEFGYGKSGDTYGDMITSSTADWAEYYDNTNYHMSLEGHAQFIYYEDDNLYFTFTGDDDVYLYINGVRVLDVGAAHSISKVKINLNDVAVLCGLRDGQPYDFNFFYMERHGTAANFGIETNIKIVDPSMTTTKTGYQNGVSTGYNGFVDPTKKVGYSFELQNNGDTKIEELTFDDADIGVSFTKDSITLNSDSNINEMYAILYNADGTTKTYYKAGELTEDILKGMLDAGLEIGEKIGIYGFKYLIPEGKWDANAFANTVYTTAVSKGENTSSRILNGIAEWKVQKKTMETDCFHVYEWKGKGVEVTKAELIQPVTDAGYEVDGNNVSIVLCTASGSETTSNLNPNATLNSDGSIEYIGTATGVDTVYYKIKGFGYDNAVFHYHIYSYDVADNTYVLDYGLPVELNGNDFGLTVNDTLKLTENSNATTATVTGITDATNNYGTFTWASPSLKYTPNDIIDNIDSVKVNIQVLEDDATELTKFTGVAMYETVTTAPASVVYYEENFPGITYVNEGENQWAHYETVDESGNSVAGTEQSADQDSNYGSDPNYEVDKAGTIVSGDSVGTVIDTTSFQLDTTDLDSLQQSGIEALNDYLGLGGSDSNGTVNELVVNTTAEVMYFDFVGTGFEIVSRTTDEQYAVINVQVQKANDDGTYTVVTQKPVITESKGGDLYQVPIISITGLEKAEYRVVVKAAGSTETKARVLYIDGIRIYGPLSDEEALEYYNPEEYQADFLEVKQLISDGKTIYADVSETDGNLELVTGTTFVEDVEANYVLTSIESVEDYMQIGPNNEIYLDGNSTTGMIAFFLTPIEEYPENARTIEIGAHRKSDSLMEDNGYVSMTYASEAQDMVDGTNSYKIASGTEQYYTIDTANLEFDSNNGRYLVMIGTNGSKNDVTTLVLTSLKLAGYEISFAESAIQTAAEEESLANEPMAAEIVTTYRLLRDRTVVEEEVVEVPTNENLKINSAALKTAKVVSGKVATLTVKADAAAETLLITDVDGNEVEFTRLTRKVSGDVATFTAIWIVEGSRGDALNFTTRVYDADGLASVNTETVTVTIK